MDLERLVFVFGSMIGINEVLRNKTVESEVLTVRAWGIE
jgi:hypothetical protein